MADYPAFKISKNDFPELSDDDKKEHLGRLKALGDLSCYIDMIRESLTRELVVNGVKEEKDVYKRLDEDTQQDLDAQAERDLNELKKNDSNSELSEDEPKTIVI
tara:strand:- start:3278 stop:3589 length:312 start_codon:yes stop_codon:yes gene_type:complete